VIDFEPDEIDTTFECARCNGRFTPRDGLPRPETVRPVIAQVPDEEDGLPVSYADEPEPWYYRFLEAYAKVVLILGIMLIVLGALLYVVSVAITRSVVDAAPATVLAAIWAVLALIALLLVVAFILLAVDAARNLREMRQEQSQTMELLSRILRQRRRAGRLGAAT
jgi:hypothetical protein